MGLFRLLDSSFKSSSAQEPKKTIFWPDDGDYAAGNGVFRSSADTMPNAPVS
jgi:hypothetical protein